MNEKQLDFFLGALSPTGFGGYYSQLVRDTSSHVVLLKAGPGCGKSTLLRRIAQHLQAQGESVETIHCSADPVSLDAVVCPARRFAVVDATAPHGTVPIHTFQAFCLADFRRDGQSRTAQISQLILISCVWPASARAPI